MKIIRITALLALSALFFACSGQDEAPEAQKHDYMKIQKKMIEQYIDSATTDIETVEYSYEKPDDIFWVKAVHKNGEGEVIRTVERELNEARLPVTETTSELDMVTETVETKYCKHHYNLLEKTVYDGEMNDSNRVKKVKYNFEDGYLVSEDVVYYASDPGFKNVDGEPVEKMYTIRFVPGKQGRPKGKYNTKYYIESYKQYCTCEDKDCKEEKEKAGEGEEKKCEKGHIEEHTTTRFNEEGYPVYYEVTNPDCEHHANKEWYKIEKDGIGNVVAITGYANEALDSSSSENMKTSFEYDKNGFVTKIFEHRYNPETGKYDRFHDMQEYTWNESGLENEMKMYCPDTRNEHYCFGQKMYSVKVKKVENPSEGKKVITELSFSVPSEDGPKPDLVKLEPKKKTTVEYTVTTK